MKDGQNAKIPVNGRNAGALNFHRLQKVGRVPVPREGPRKLIVVCNELMQSAIANFFKAIGECSVKLVVVEIEMPQAAHIVCRCPPFFG